MITAISPSAMARLSAISAANSGPPTRIAAMISGMPTAALSNRVARLPASSRSRSVFVSVIAALRRGVLASMCFGVRARIGEIPAASADMTVQCVYSALAGRPPKFLVRWA